MRNTCEKCGAKMAVRVSENVVLLCGQCRKVKYPARRKRSIDPDDLLKIKTYLENVNFINYGIRADLVEEWGRVYAIVYKTLNGESLTTKGASNENKF